MPARQGIGVETGRGVSVNELSLGKDSNHRGVVSAQRRWRQTQLEFLAVARGLKIATKASVARDTAGGRHATHTDTPRGSHRFCDQHLNNRCLHTRAEITQTLLIVQHSRIALQKIPDGRLQSGKTEIVARITQAVPWFGS